MPGIILITRHPPFSELFFSIFRIFTLTLTILLLRLYITHTL